jgi:arsenate reductase (thioredoxin)
MAGPKVLFLCTGNSCRSQMAEGFLRSIAGDRFEAASAGTDPRPIHSMAIEAMRERGIDISGQRSKGVKPFLGQHFPYVIAVCDRANERCPIFPGVVKRLHWSFDDPARAEGTEAERLAVFRRVRGQIEEHVRRFVAEVEGSKPLTGLPVRTPAPVPASH